MTVVWVVLSLLALVVAIQVGWLIARALHWLPSLSARDMRLVEKRRHLTRNPYDAHAMHLCLDFDNTHPWVKRWERRWGKGE